MVVYVVDDDEGMQHSLSFVLGTADLPTVCFSSGAQLLSHFDELEPGCLVVDFLMPDMNGLQLVEEIRARGSKMPFILVTGHGVVSMAVKAMKMGAVSVLEKPFHHELLLDLIDAARASLAQVELEQKLNCENESVIQRLNTLTSRETEVMELVVRGDLTKQIAKQLGISNKTVEVHRSNITRKMGVQSVAQLVTSVVSIRARAH